MKGFNNEPLIERSLLDVVPLRYNVLVRVHDERPDTKLVLPESEQKNHTDGRHGTIVAMGNRVAGSMTAEGLLHEGAHVLFDESVSIDDPNRCFKYEGDVYIMFDVGTIMAVLTPADKESYDDWLKMAAVLNRPLTAIGQKIAWVLGDRIIVSRPLIGEQKTDSGIIKPTGDWLKKVGGITISGGKWARHVGGVVEAAGMGIVIDRLEDGTDVRGEMSIQAGDHVLFPKYGHTDITIDGIPCAIMQQDHVLAKFTPRKDEEELYVRRSESIRA